MTAFSWAACALVSAQWLNYPTPGIPRMPDGKPNLTAPAPRTADRKPDLSGVWNGQGPGSYDRNIARDLKTSDIQPWAEALYQQRVRDMGLNAPRANCLPDPFVYYHVVDVARIVQTPGVIVMMYQGTTNGMSRTIFTDGRPLPAEPNPTWMGYSIGHWEGETLVVETAGFNDDPKAFTRPFSLKLNKTLLADSDLLEGVCENDRSVTHMLGGTGARLPPEVLAKYAGTFEFTSGRPAVITFEGDLLFLQEGTNPLKLPLAPNSESVFVSRTDGAWIEFVRDAQGVATEFTHHGESNRRAVRKVSPR